MKCVSEVKLLNIILMKCIIPKTVPNFLLKLNIIILNNFLREKYHKIGKFNQSGFRDTNIFFKSFSVFF